MEEKRKFRWYIAVALIIGLALLAISCGSGTTTQEQPPTEKQQPPIEQEQPAAEEPKTEETEVTGDPPAIPHTLEGRDDCLQCHGESGFKPFPANHTGRTSDTCKGCHKPAG
ncbi:MAG: hypothetical protein V3R96_04855 [Dehalococcoidales bacterium]